MGISCKQKESLCLMPYKMTILQLQSLQFQLGKPILNWLLKYDIKFGLFLYMKYNNKM